MPADVQINAALEDRDNEDLATCARIYSYAEHCVMLDKHNRVANLSKARVFDATILDDPLLWRAYETIGVLPAPSDIPAITSEPLLAYYQEQLANYRRQMKIKDSELQILRRQVVQKARKQAMPSITWTARKTFSEASSHSKKRVRTFLFEIYIRTLLSVCKFLQTLDGVKEAMNTLLSACTVEDRSVVLRTAFPVVFPAPEVQRKLTRDQTLEFERKFKLKPSNMEKYRIFLNQFECNPFAGRRLLNRHREWVRANDPDRHKPNSDDSDTQEGEDEEEEEEEEDEEEEAAQPSVRVTRSQRRVAYRSYHTANDAAATVQHQQQQQQMPLQPSSPPRTMNVTSVFGRVQQQTFAQPYVAAATAAANYAHFAHPHIHDQHQQQLLLQQPLPPHNFVTTTAMATHQTPQMPQIKTFKCAQARPFPY